MTTPLMSPYWTVSLCEKTPVLFPPLTSIRMPKGWRHGTIAAIAGIDLGGMLTVIHNGAGLRPNDSIPDLSVNASAAHDLAGAMPWAGLSVAKAVQAQFYSDMTLPAPVRAAIIAATWPWALLAATPWYKRKERTHCLLSLRAQLYLAIARSSERNGAAALRGLLSAITSISRRSGAIPLPSNG